MLRDIVLRNKRLFEENKWKFAGIFERDLHDFMVTDDLTKAVLGFDIVKFDDEVVRSGDRSMAAVIEGRWGKAGLEVIENLLGGDR